MFAGIFFCPDNVGVDTDPGSGHCSPIGLLTVLVYS